MLDWNRLDKCRSFWHWGDSYIEKIYSIYTSSFDIYVYIYGKELSLECVCLLHYMKYKISMIHICQISVYTPEHKKKNIAPDKKALAK